MDVPQASDGRCRMDLSIGFSRETAESISMKTQFMEQGYIRARCMALLYASLTKLNESIIGELEALFEGNRIGWKEAPLVRIQG